MTKSTCGIRGLALAAVCTLLALPAGAAASPAPLAPAPASVPPGVPTAGEASQSAIDPATDTAFVASRAGDVEAVDMATGAISATIPAGDGPFAIGVDPVTGMVYAANYFGDSVSVINSATDTVTATITGLAGKPAGVAVDPVTDTIYVQFFIRGGPGQIAVIDGATSTLRSTITAPPGTPGGAGEQGIAVNPVTDTVYAIYGGAGTELLVIDGATDAITSTMTGLNGISEVAVNPATNGIYIAGARSVTAYDGGTGAKTATADLGSPIDASIAFNPATGTVYVPVSPGSEGPDAVLLLDGATLATTGTLPIGTPHNVAVNPATDTLAIETGGQLNLVTLQAPTITSQGHATLTAGRASTFTATATAAPPPTYAETGKLPAGITLTTTGHLTGTPRPRTGGRYPITITASNGVEPGATQIFNLTVNQAPIITSQATTRFPAGTRRAFTIRVSAFPAATLTEHGKLPPGLRFTAHRGGTATITGTPPRSARGKTFRIRVTARSRIGKPATQRLTIRIT